MPGVVGVMCDEVFFPGCDAPVKSLEVFLLVDPAEL